MKLTGNLQTDKNAVISRISSDDMKTLDIKAGEKDGIIIFIDPLTNKELLGKLAVIPLKHTEGEGSLEQVKEALGAGEVTEVETDDDGIKEILSGNPLIIIDGSNTALSVGAKHVEARAVAEPPTSTVVKGPRAGFTENVMTSVTLIRQKLKSEHLKFNYLTVGKYSGTQVAVTYIDGIAPPDLVDKVKKLISEINTDGILDSSYIARYLVKRKASMFKQYGTTEKPDVLCSKLLEGKVAVLVEGSPIAITLPYVMLEDFQSPSDYYTLNYKAVIERLLRLAAVILAIFLPAFYVAAELFHLQLIPLKFLLTIVSSIRGIPLSPSFEMFFTLMIFEILNEASVRMPKHVGMVISIVGGLVLGETAVNAGIISAPTLMIMALSGICLFTAPELQETFSIIRLIFLLAGGSLGGYSIIILSVTLAAYLVDFENMKTPILAPYAPLVESDLSDGFIKKDQLEMTKRPKIFRSKNKTRTVIKKERR